MTDETLEELSNTELADRVKTADPAELRRVARELLRRLGGIPKAQPEEVSDLHPPASIERHHTTGPAPDTGQAALTEADTDFEPPAPGPPQRSSHALHAARPETPTADTLPHSQTPLTEDERTAVVEWLWGLRGWDPSYPRPGESWMAYWDARSWPIAEKAEFWDGAPVWMGGPYGESDVRAIERAFPGWTGVLLSHHTLTIRPADPDIPWPPG